MDARANCSDAVCFLAQLNHGFARSFTAAMRFMTAVGSVA